MGREQNLEREFNRRLDALLAHKEVEPVLDGDTRSALEFAGKLNALCVKPSSEYKARLKASLLQRMARQEAEKANRPGFFSRLVPHQPMLRLATALALIALVSTAVWATGIFNHQPGVITPASPLAVSASTNKFSYSPGETVFIDVSLTNTTSDNLSIEKYPPILNLMDASNKQPVYTFRAGTRTEVIAPNQTATFILTWNQQNDKGNSVGRGHYYIELEDLYYQGHDIKLAPSQTVSFDILPAPTQQQATIDEAVSTTGELGMVKTSPRPDGLSFGVGARYKKGL